MGGKLVQGVGALKRGGAGTPLQTMVCSRSEVSSPYLMMSLEICNLGVFEKTKGNG